MRDLFLIRDRESNGDFALWWKPEGAGYTIHLDRAGRYATKPLQFEAEKHEWVPESLALEAARQFVVMDDLQAAQKEPEKGRGA
jgi:hypothetical protein